MLFVWSDKNEKPNERNDSILTDAFRFNFFFPSRNADPVLIAICVDALKAHQRQKLHFMSVLE